MKRILHRPHLYWVIGIFVLYLVVATYVSEFYVTVQYLTAYASQIHWGKLVLGILFTITIAALVAINSVQGYVRWKERQAIAKTGAVACVGAIGGLATGVCSSCVTSVFPLVLGLFGVTFSWASLPFQGLEIQALTVAALAGSWWWMGK